MTWRDLLDPHQADRMARAVRVAITNMVDGCPSLLQVDLRAEVIKPAELYIHEEWSGDPDDNRGDISACRTLIDVAERLADQIEAGYPFHEAAADECAQQLRLAWSWFIEQRAAPELAYMLARRSMTAKRSAEHRRKPRVSADGIELTDEGLVQAMANARGRRARAAVLKSLSDTYGVSQRTLRNDLKTLMALHPSGK